jgi:hypothetical protein
MNFAAFSPGSIDTAKVYPNLYEANAVDIEYNWIF